MIKTTSAGKQKVEGGEATDETRDLEKRRKEAPGQVMHEENIWYLVYQRPYTNTF
jgi:hypothetical protein